MPSVREVIPGPEEVRRAAPVQPVLPLRRHQASRIVDNAHHVAVKNEHEECDADRRRVAVVDLDVRRRAVGPWWRERNRLAYLLEIVVLEPPDVEPRAEPRRPPGDPCTDYDPGWQARPLGACGFT